METYKQDLTQKEDKGTIFMMQLLMEDACQMPRQSDIERVLKKHLGDDMELCSYSDKVAGIAVTKYKAEYEEGNVAPMLSIFKCMEFDGKRIDSITRSQMWDCPEHDEILDSCRYHVLASDMLGAVMQYKERADMLMDYLEALVELFPACKAVYFVNSGKMFTAEAIRSHNIPHDDRFIYFAVNVRFFSIQDSPAMIVDTVGMEALDMPDLQYHFHGMDPNFVVNHAYNVLSYMYENDNPIENNNTIDGIADGEMSDKVLWKCCYEESLIQPVRAVIDINMGELASGVRSTADEDDN